MSKGQKDFNKWKIRRSTLILLASTFLSLSLSSCGSDDEKEQMKQEIADLKEQLTKEKQTNLQEQISTDVVENVEIQPIENEFITNVGMEPSAKKEYKASDLWVIEADGKRCILEYLGETYRTQVYPTNYTEKLRRLNELGIDASYDDISYEFAQFEWLSVFENTEGEHCCFFWRQSSDWEVENTNTSIGYSNVHDYYNVTGDFSYCNNVCTPIKTSYQLKDGYDENEAAGYVDRLLDCYSYKCYRSSDYSWENDMSLVEFTKVFDCNPDDTFTSENLREILEELNSQKTLGLHK